MISRPNLALPAAEAAQTELSATLWKRQPVQRQPWHTLCCKHNAQEHCHVSAVPAKGLQAHPPWDDNCLYISGESLSAVRLPLGVHVLAITMSAARGERFATKLGTISPSDPVE